MMVFGNGFDLICFIVITKAFELPQIYQAFMSASKADAELLLTGNLNRLSGLWVSLDCISSSTTHPLAVISDWERCTLEWVFVFFLVDGRGNLLTTFLTLLIFGSKIYVYFQRTDQRNLLQVIWKCCAKISCQKVLIHWFHFLTGCQENYVFGNYFKDGNHLLCCSES